MSNVQLVLRDVSVLSFPCIHITICIEWWRVRPSIQSWFYNVIYNNKFPLNISVHVLLQTCDIYCFQRFIFFLLLGTNLVRVVSTLFHFIIFKSIRTNNLKKNWIKIIIFIFIKQQQMIVLYRDHFPVIIVSFLLQFWERQLLLKDSKKCDCICHKTR